MSFNVPFAYYAIEHNGWRQYPSVTPWTEFVRTICTATNCKTYLEIGVLTGETLSSVAPFVDRAVGVDIKDSRSFKQGEFYLMSSDDFFSSNPSFRADVIYVDGSHVYEQVEKDFENSLKILNKHGIIILDDTDPITKRYEEFDKCGTAFKIVNYIRTNHPELDIVTLPFFEKGQSIVKRKNESRVLERS